MDTNAKLYQDMTKILVKREDIQKAVAQLGREITHDYQGRDLVMVCILKGASVFFSDLIRAIATPPSPPAWSIWRKTCPCPSRGATC